MNVQNPRPQPELQENGNQPSSPRPEPEMLVQYPRSDKVTVVLPDPEASDRSAQSWASRARARAGLLWNAEAASGIGGVLELSPHLPWLVAVSGLALVAFLWSTILL